MSNTKNMKSSSVNNASNTTNNANSAKNIANIANNASNIASIANNASNIANNILVTNTANSSNDYSAVITCTWINKQEESYETYINIDSRNNYY
jgi:hypothetical protein